MITWSVLSLELGLVVKMNPGLLPFNLQIHHFAIPLVPAVLWTWSGIGVRTLSVADLQHDYVVFLVQKVKIKPVHIVDVPGHARLRPKLDDFLSKTCGLVFVVDALDFMPHLRSAAEYILSSSFLPYCVWSLMKAKVSQIVWQDTGLWYYAV